MHNQQQRKTYYVKQTVKPCKTQQSIRKAPIKAEKKTNAATKKIRQLLKNYTNIEKQQEK